MAILLGNAKHIPHSYQRSKLDYIYKIKGDKREIDCWTLQNYKKQMDYGDKRENIYWKFEKQFNIHRSK
jgi:hypothetical protein